jgi:hypothetical protein
MGTSDRPASTPDVRMLQRALEAYGSVHHLAKALGVSVEDLKLWVSGKELPPHQVFMKALELAFSGPVKGARKKPGRK